MAGSGYSWSAVSRRYRNNATGRYVAQTTVRAYRDAFLVIQQEWATGLAALLADGQISVQKYEAEFMTRLQRNYAAEYALGRGGRAAMTAADLTRVSDLLNAQAVYLRAFVGEIAAGSLSAEMIAARGAMYFSSAVQAFERGRASAWDVELPAYPGDGSSECKSRDRCSWQLVDKKETVEATWHLGSVQTEHCPTCVSRAAMWAPLVLTKVGGVQG